MPKISPEIKQRALQQLEQILRRSIEKRASDLHLKSGLPPIVRVNGSLFYLGDESGEAPHRLNGQVLIEFCQALMNDKQWDRFEAGEEVDLGFEVSGSGRFRINICQQRSNPRLVCRHIPDTIKNIQDLELPKIVEELTAAQRGLILVTGATGSGKSTTLAAVIDHIARTQSCHIITIEDPIEFTFRDRKSIITQREVGLDTKGFALALKYALRQDPDVILVGEMRDEETIMMAMAAAETGHLVLSTLHTVDASETINRILGSISPEMQNQARMQMASVLVGVVAQRLVKRADGRGRIAAIEVLLNNSRVRELINTPKAAHDLTRVIEESRTEGMQSFDQSLMELVKSGRITKEEALENCSNLRDFQMRLDGVVAGEWRGTQETHLTRQEKMKRILENEGTQNQSIEIEEALPKRARR